MAHIIANMYIYTHTHTHTHTHTYIYIYIYEEMKNYLIALRYLVALPLLPD